MATGRAIFQAHVDGLYPESIPIDLQWTFPACIGQFQTVTLASGDNTIAVPAGTTLIAIVPPTTNSVVIKKKGLAGDTGTIIDPNQPDLHSYGGGTFIVNAASSIAGVQLAFF